MRKEDFTYFNDLTDAELLGLCIEREAAGEPHEGRIAVGTTVLERVKRQGWMGKNIKSVILKPWQYSWTMPEAGISYYLASVELAKNFAVHLGEYSALKECLDIATGLIDGTIPEDPDLEAINCCQYCNPKTTSAATIQKWLAGGMKVVKVIAHHEFFDDGKRVHS